MSHRASISAISLAGRSVRPGKRGACAPDWPHCTAHKGYGSKGDIAYPVRRQSPKPITKLLDQECLTSPLPRPFDPDRLMLFQIALRKTATALTSLVAAAAIARRAFSAAHAQAKGPPVLRDTETEQLLREYTRPILRAAGLEKQNIQMVILNEASFNAFVADGRRIFVNYGAILQSETPNQIIGVLAHETGHLAGGHLAKMREQMAAAQTQMIIAMLLGAGAIAVGSTRGSSSAGNNGLANAGAAAIAGPQEMIRRTLLSYQRQQEENADRAGVKFLTATQQSPKGMYETFKRFTSESLFAARGADPYLQSHPMPAERVASLQEFA